MTDDARRLELSAALGRVRVALQREHALMGDHCPGDRPCPADLVVAWLHLQDARRCVRKALAAIAAGGPPAGG